MGRGDGTEKEVGIEEDRHRNGREEWRWWE